MGVAQASATPVINGSHYQETLTVQCGNVSSCSLLFTAVPVGKELLVTRVTCAVVYDGSSVEITYMLLAHRQGASKYPPYTHLIPVLLSNNASIRVYNINNDAYQIFSAGQIPDIYTAAVVGKANSLECTVFGTLSLASG